ncbi:MAG: HAD family hydrolase [Phenylobacterium sp.]|jgi:HAD superfamily hydrolase (TIGR01493 family)|uniref:HAD family hydrolase n=1 Tax=Phenylobacterium sp. TaxID=1871053 RepID=UPI00391C8D81
MPKAVLWDVGNVIVRWNPRTLYEKFFEEPAECDRFLSHVCTMEWHVRHDLGVTFEENRKPLLDEFPEYAEAILAWEQRWWEMFSGTIAEAEAAIEALHARGVPQFVLSNMSHEVFDGITAMSPAFRRIEGFVISANEKLMKPQPEIYQRACERFGCAPEDFLFVDDSAWNIAAAAELGFDTLHFTDPAALRPALESRGLL